MTLTRQQRRAQERAQLKAARREEKSHLHQPAAPTVGSTGPRTEAGKAISSRNALSHGLTSARLVLPWESQAEFDQLLAGLQAEHQPQTPSEAIYVREMAEQYWRLERARNEEHELLCQSRNLGGDEEAIGKWRKQVQLVTRYVTRHERAFHRCFQVLRTLQKERRLREAEQPSRPREFVSQNQETLENATQTAATAASSAPRMPLPSVHTQVLMTDEEWFQAVLTEESALQAAESRFDSK